MVDPTPAPAAPPGAPPGAPSAVPEPLSEAYVGTFTEIGGQPMRTWPRYSDPKPQCVTCSVRTICEGCRHDDGCTWCNCDGLGCGTCGTKCRSHASRELWQADVGSFDLWVDLRGQPEISLPRYVPSVKAREKMRGALPKWTYTITVSDLIRADGSPREIAHRVRSFFPEGSQLVLNFFCEDRYLEPIWTMGPEFFAQEWLDQFDAIIAVNYSLYEDDSSFEIMHSLKRSYMSAQEIHDTGHTVIPLLSYVTMKQAVEQVEALGASEVHTVAINMQVVEGEKATFQKENVEIMRHIAFRTDWRVIAHGIARQDVIGELFSIFGDRLVLSNADPYFRAMRRHKGQRAATLRDGMRRYLGLASGDRAQSTRKTEKEDNTGE